MEWIDELYSECCLPLRVRIQSKQLAENYLTEFEEMFLDHQFGAGSPANKPLPILEIEGNVVKVYFSPDDGTLERVLELVQSAGEVCISWLIHSPMMIWLKR